MKFYNSGLVFVTSSCNFKYWLIWNFVNLCVIASKNVFNSFCMCILFDWVIAGIFHLLNPLRNGKAKGGIKLNLLLHTHKLFCKLFFLLFLLRYNMTYFFHGVLFRKGIEMFLLIPIEIIKAWYFLLDFGFDFQNIFLTEIFWDGLIFFFKNSYIVLVIKSKVSQIKNQIWLNFPNE